MIDEDLKPFTFVEWSQYCETLHDKILRSWIDEARELVVKTPDFLYHEVYKTVQEQLRIFMSNKIALLQKEFIEIIPPFTFKIHADT